MEPQMNTDKVVWMVRWGMYLACIEHRLGSHAVGRQARSSRAWTWMRPRIGLQPRKGRRAVAGAEASEPPVMCKNM